MSICWCCSLTASTLCRTDDITFILTPCVKIGNTFLLGYDAESMGFRPRRFEVTHYPYFERVTVIEGTLKMRTLSNLETSVSDTHWRGVISQKNEILFDTAAKISEVDYTKTVRVSVTRRDAAEFSRDETGQRQQGTEKVGGRRSGRPWPEHGSKRHKIRRRGRRRKMGKYVLLLLLLQ